MIIIRFLLITSLLLNIEKFLLIWAMPILLGSLIYYFWRELSTRHCMGIINIDYFSWLLILILIWVYIYCMFNTQNSYSNIYLWFIFSLLVSSFLVDNFILFYILFELVFLFIFMYLLIWGKTIERIQASFYIFFFTLIFSLPLLIFLLKLCTQIESSYFSRVSRFYFTNNQPIDWLVYFLILVFIVKLPVYGFHIWLPKAHVEAPILGSMLLAGVLLKLGGYGIFRFMLTINLRFKSKTWGYLFYLCLIGAIIIILFCMRQRDIKIIIAYSSIVHISFILIGLISQSIVGIYGCLLILISHGFISPFLFYRFNYIYETLHSRRIFILKGALLLIPAFCLFWFLGLALNIGLPPFISFFSEVSIAGSISFTKLLDWSLILLFFFFCGAYNIYLYVITVICDACK